jgi:hypothetical protein
VQLLGYPLQGLAGNQFADVEIDTHGLSCYTSSMRPISSSTSPPSTWSDMG